MAHPLEAALQIFVGELREQSGEITRNLLRTQREPDLAARRELMDELLRHAHTVKGTAGSLGLAEVEEVGHAIETALAPCRSGEKVASAVLTEAVMRALDHAQARVEALLGGVEQPDLALSVLASRLVELGPTAQAPQSATAADLPAAARTPSGVEADTVRVASARLDALERQLDGLRELNVALDRRVEQARQLERVPGLQVGPARAVGEPLQSLRRSLSADAADLRGRVADIEDELRLARMLPLESLVGPLERAVFEHALSVGKQARLTVTGTELTVDRRLLEALRHALGHLVRNAVDHGIESVEVRAAAGKPLEGHVALTFEQQGGHLRVLLQDDGAGIDAERVRRRAVERGLLDDAAAAALDQAGIEALLFASGFSTTDAVSRTSGRGVGLDVVRDGVQRLGGTVALSSELGRGTRFTLQLPLSLATTQSVLFEAQGFLLALPLVAVGRAVHARIDPRAGMEVLDLDGRLLPLGELGATLGLGTSPARIGACPVLLVQQGGRELALRVDRLIGERELVFKPLPPELSRLGYLASVAPQGDGRLVYMLSARWLLEATRPLARELAPAHARPRVLVVDDSLTTRTLHRQVLEAAGFEVETAGNGEQAWDVLRVRQPELVVSDVQMPRLDGLGLARRIRADPATAELPVILISSLDAEEDHARATAAGASAYLTKQAYQRGELLRLVQRFLGKTMGSRDRSALAGSSR
jgi:two-component system chemotaxis sensor kinase CheA